MRKWLIIVAAIVGISVIATGCGSMKLDDFKDTKPEFRLETYFAGETKASGIFEDRFGKLRRQFTVDIIGEWDGETLILTEDFIYDDGEEERRVWRIQRDGENGYVGSAEGVIGEARGSVSGQALNWVYEFDLKIGDGTTRVKFDDWMWLQPNDVLINRAVVTKFGIELGRATIFFYKGANAQAAQTYDDLPAAAE